MFFVNFYLLSCKARGNIVLYFNIALSASASSTSIKSIIDNATDISVLYFAFFWLSFANARGKVIFNLERSNQREIKSKGHLTLLCKNHSFLNVSCTVANNTSLAYCENLLTHRLSCSGTALVWVNE